jgi:hypothetical protein
MGVEIKSISLSEKKYAPMETRMMEMRDLITLPLNSSRCSRKPILSLFSAMFSLHKVLKIQSVR